MFKLCSSYFKEKKLFLFPLLLVIVIFGLFNNYQVTKSDVQANNLDMDITTLINSQGLGVLIPKVSNNSINTVNVRSQTSVPDNLVWPANNDYALALDPNSNGGYIAYVRTPNQYLHAIYGYSSVGDPNPQNYDQVLSIDTYTNKSNITRVVLVANIDLVNTFATSLTNPDPNNPDITMNYPNTKNKFTLPIWGNLLTGVSGNHTGGDAPRTMAIQRPSKDNTLTIDGNGHSINVGNMAIQTCDVGGNYKMTIALQNATIYNSSYYGYIWGRGNTQEIYKDVNYFGAQFLYSTGNVNIEIYDTINAFSLRQYYVPGDTRPYHCEGNGNQQNMQAQNVDFGEDCIYNGYTYSGNVLELTGGATVHDGATVNLYPHTAYNSPTTGITGGIVTIPEDSYGSGTSAGIYMLGGTVGAVPQLKIGKNAQLNIQVDRKPLADALTKINPDVIYHDPIMDTGYVTPATALILSAANSKIQYVDHSNSTINLTSDGALAGYGIALIQGGVVDIGEGNMQIAANNLGTSNVNLVQLGPTGKVFVNKNGSFDIQAPKATGNVNMIYSTGTFKINVYKPKSLSIARPNNNSGSNIIYGTGSVEMRDIQAVVPTGTGESITIPFQYLKLPFYGNYMYSSNSGNIMNAQTSTSALKKLNIILRSLSTNPSNTQFKQFEKIDVTTIGNGPDITKNQFNIDPVQRKITGSVVDADDKTQPVNNARLHVTLQRAGSPTAIDLGDTSDDITKLDPDLDSIDPQNLSTPHYAAVEPDKVSWFADHHDIAGVAQDSLTSPGNRLSKPWKYVTSSALTWKDNNFSLDIDDIVRTYDKTAVNKIGTLLPSDKLTVTAVDNFQASTVYTVKISSLYLNLNDKQAKKYYVLGDDIQVPLIYQENIASSKQMNVKGYLNPLAHSTLKPNAADFSSDFAIKGDNKSNQLTWTIPNNDMPGNHELKFYGIDDQNGQSPTNTFDDNGNILTDQLISYKYTVLNLPGYSGNKQLYQGQDKKFSTEAGFTNPDRLGMGNYTEKNFFTPKDDTATIDNVTFTRGDGTAADTDSPDVHVNHVVKVIATNKAGKSQTHTYITNGNPIKVLPKDFGLIAVGGSFPRGTSFEVDTNVRVLKPTKDLKLASLHMQTDFTHSDGSHEDIQLGESGQIKIGNVYYLQLTVPNRLDFGKHRFKDEIYSITNKQSVYDNLLLVYDPIIGNQLKVTMQLQSDLTNDNNDIWENALFFKQTSASASQFFQKDGSGNSVAVPVYSTTVGSSSNLPVNTHLSENWWNNSDKQVAGIFLKSNSGKFRQGRYTGQITWNLTNSI